MAALVYLFFPTYMFSLLVTGLIALALSFAAPVGALLLFGFLLPFEHARELWGWGTVYTGEMLLLVCLPGWLWHIVRQRAWQRSSTPVAFWLLPFAVVVAVSAFYVQTPIAMKGALRWMEFILVAILGVHILRRGQEAERLLWVLLLAGIISAGQGIMQSITGITDDPHVLRIMTSYGEIVRAGAGFGPNTLAVFVAVLLPFSAAAALFHPQGSGRLLGLLATPILLAALLFTFSFTGLVALGTAGTILAFHLFWKMIRFRMWLITIIASAFVLFVLWQPGWMAGSFWETKWMSLLDRFAYLGVVGKLFLQSPWVGIGPGMYRFLAPTVAGSDVNVIGVITHPHSLWLMVLAETGFLGIMTLLWTGGRVAKVLLEQVRQLPFGWPSAMGWVLSASCVGFVMANFFEHCLVHDRGMHMALFVSATLVVVRRWSKNSRPEGKQVFEAAWQNEKKSNWKMLVEQRRSGRGPLYALLEDALAKRIRPKILEVGCGPALDALHLAEKKGREVHALDISATALKMAATASRQLKRKLILHQADIRQTGLPTSSFDVIFSQGVLEHFPDAQSVMIEMNRLLKPGGVIVIDVPQTVHPYTLIKWVHRLRGDWPWGWETQYTVGDLRTLAQPYGLKMRGARGYGYRGGRWDATAWLRDCIQPIFPKIWKALEERLGAYWMMNVVVLFQKGKS
jgi:SAM-dependent methyltransferase/O-antigen ligase